MATIGLKRPGSCAYYASFDVFADSIDLYHSQINTVLSPRGNEVNIWIFKRTPFGATDVDLAAGLRSSAREQFMKYPDIIAWFR